MSDRPYFSIGEVLGLLLEEFSDVTISKIRFLESQGLIDPERTSSGYRKFYDGDVERLRYILREQKDNYLPLKVIKERLDGIDNTLPNPPRPVPMGASWATAADDTDHPVFPAEPRTTVGEEPDHGLAPALDPEHDAAISPAAPAAPTPVEPEAAPPAPAPTPAPTPPAPAPVTPTPVPETIIRSAPVQAPAAQVPAAAAASLPAEAIDPDPTPAVRAPVLSLVRDDRAPLDPDYRLSGPELCQRSGITPAVLRQLEEYGLLSGRAMGTETTYDAEALRLADVARRFLELGLEVRHLRTWRMNAEKEMSLFDALVLPLLRQRNPQARQHASETMGELADLGAELRGLLIDAARRASLDR